MLFGVPLQALPCFKGMANVRNLFFDKKMRWIIHTFPAQGRFGGRNSFTVSKAYLTHYGADWF